jgi:hypothetical protein
MDKAENHLFILRAWQDGGAWRWSLQDNDKNERLGFPDLDSLYLHLSSLTIESTPANESKSIL